MGHICQVHRLLDGGHWMLLSLHFQFVLIDTFINSHDEHSAFSHFLFPLEKERVRSAIRFADIVLKKVVCLFFSTQSEAAES